MKISIITKKPEAWHVSQLMRSAVKRGVEAEITDVKDLNDLGDLTRMGDVIIWRDGSVDLFSGKNAFFNLMSDRYIINAGVGRFPYVTHKLFQQKCVARLSSIRTIPTYTFNNEEDLLAAIARGTLSYPFVQKPNLGSKGEGVSLIRSQEELFKEQPVRHYVYQPFIKNTGDYRVFMVGGKALGIIKRVAKEGSFLNNISQGATAVTVTEPALCNELKTMAAKVSALFDLAVCGVDIIRSEEDGQLYFLELNTVPQWMGFQHTTGIEVADHIIDLAIGFGKRKGSSPAELVKDYYDQHLDALGDRKFHYLTRKYLYLHDQEAYAELEKMRQEYLGADEDGIAANITRRLAQQYNETAVKPGEKDRAYYFSQYPKLFPYLKVLMLSFFAKTIYHEDIRPIIARQVPDESFIQLKDSLEKDPEAIGTLSTHAVNYLYFLEYHLYGMESEDHQFIDVPALIQLGGRLLKAGMSFQRPALYLLQHCILGEAGFYSRQIGRHREICQQAIQMIENHIQSHYFDLSLDIKLEFLVCYSLLGHATGLKAIILSEADHSWSPIGNYLIDTASQEVFHTAKDMAASEHRNVLYLMANQ